MPIDSKLLATGMRHHRNGAFQEAHEIFRRLLVADPQNAVLFNMLGAACIGLGQLSEAGAYLAETLRLDPDLAAAHDNLGLLLMAQDRFAEAIVSFRRAAAGDPRSVSTQLNLAHAMLRSGQIAEAIEVLRHVARLSPDNVQACVELARLLCEQGRQAEALPHLKHVTGLQPDDAGAHFELAAALAQVGQRAESIAVYQAAIRLKPDSPEGCANLAKLYFEQKLFDEAVRWSRRALELRPGFAEAQHNLGCALSKQEKYEEAIEALQTALHLKPQMNAAYNNLGVAFAAAGKFDTAISHYRHALSLRSTDLEALCNLGNVYLRLNDVQTAIAHYERALALQPENAEARHCRAVAWLLEGKYAEGLPEYEWRLKTQEYVPARLQGPRWRGEPLSGRTIVLCAEGGLGDTIQFVRYAPLLQRQGARVVVACSAALHRILAHTPGVDALITPSVTSFAADFCVPMISVAYHLQTTLETVPVHIPYVFADEQLLETWRQRLTPWEGFKVGIVWQGNSQFRGDRSRSIPLARFAPLARVPGVRLVNLQKGAGLEQLREFAEPWSVIDFGDAVDQSAGAFMDTAAIMKNLDLVITSDTAAAHLAGALGVNVWLALQMVPDWRWMLQREDSPWYPTMRLFRQTQLGDWPEVFERIACELERLVVKDC